MKAPQKASVVIDINGMPLKLETGHLAFQAHGAVTATYGETIVLATVVMSEKPREGIDFFPLMVDYEEKWYASGKISGSRYVKREGRPTDDAILSARLIDRPIRPLFPKGMSNDVQIICSVISSDKKRHAATTAMIAASAALNISGMPFKGPIAGVRVGLKDGAFIINPSYQEVEEGEMDLVVAGTADAVMMVEAGMKEVSEEKVLEAINFAHEYIKKICALQEELKKSLTIRELPVLINLPDETVKKEIQNIISSKELDALYSEDKHEVLTRFDALTEAVLEKVKDKIEDDANTLWTRSSVSDAVDKIFKEYMRENILTQGRRLDGRKPEDVRELSVQVGVLPRPHGSALFQRGETQILSVATLASPGAAQSIDSMDLEYERRYMHHYNFPPYSTGEVKPLRGTGRREIGHGHLAERALIPVLPSKEQFPYTMRVVSETLSCNGSTSMGSVCGSALALMDAGVPISAPVVGIAMGLVTTEDNSRYKILTDIQGQEDFAGDMDFKVARTDKGVTALQMDIKVGGIPIEIMKDALAQAQKGIETIKQAMIEVLPASRKELSRHAPLITSIQILPDQIGMVIGKGGEMIQEITKECGVEIDIEESGLVMITAPDQESGKKAKEWIEKITYVPKVGDTFEGKVVRITDFGAFVEVSRGKDGLLHISQISDQRVNRVEDVLKMGQIVKVKLKDIDEQGRLSLTMKGVQ